MNSPYFSDTFDIECPHAPPGRLPEHTVSYLKTMVSVYAYCAPCNTRWRLGSLRSLRTPDDWERKYKELMLPSLLVVANRWHHAQLATQIEECRVEVQAARARVLQITEELKDDLDVTPRETAVEQLRELLRDLEVEV